MKQMYKADLLLLFVTFIWGSTFGIVKDAFQDISPFLFNVIRFCSAAGIFFLLFRRHILHAPKKTVIGGVITRTFLGFDYNAQNLGLYITSASNSAFITGLSVVIVPILAILYVRCVPRWNVLTGVLLAVIGLRLLTAADASGGFTTGAMP